MSTNKNKNTVTLVSIIGTPNAILQKFGLEAFEEVDHSLTIGEHLTISFSGIKNVTSGFFHSFVGKLYKKYGDSLFKRVEFMGIDENPDWREKFNDSIELVKNPKLASEIDKAIAQLFER